MSLKPWRSVITPHKDIFEGNFQEAEFAADLTKVAKGTAELEYLDPVQFFERTFITEGMGLLLKSVVKRVLGSGGDPVVQLKTAFGGGKTHAMLAVYHLVRGEQPTKDLAGIPIILDEIGALQLPKCNIAVLDGTALGPSQPRTYDGTVVNTLWGEMAWQLGGQEAYSMLSQSDKDGSSPGKEILADLFKRYAPCVVLIDEAVAYTRQFHEGKSYPGGTFESNMSFIQALTEAAAQPNPVVILASLPESEMELGGERGKLALKHIENVFGRIEAVWKPVSTEEGFEIVRRRLFGPVGNPDDRDSVCNAFFDLYAQHSDQYPSETSEHSYLKRLKDAYPIHPEVFDRLYGDWATLEKFHRTRGVLRLMAKVIHRLWIDGNQDLMIMPGTLPIYDTDVCNELLRYLPQGWEPVVEKEIDGPGASPTRLDEKVPVLGGVQAARRAARTVFLGSAPSVAAMRVRGVRKDRIHVGCVQPEQQSGHYDDALRRLSDQLHHLYSERGLYWYDTRPNLRREMEARASRFQIQEHLIPEIGARLRKLVKGKPFRGVHVFTPHTDIPDDTEIRLVILSPLECHRRKKADSGAASAAKGIQHQRGGQPRLNQNRLIYLAANEDSISHMWHEARRYLAWKSIVDDKEKLNLDHHQTKEAIQNQNEASEKIETAVIQAYRWVLAPAQETKPRGGLTDLFFEEYSISAGWDNPIAAISKVLQENEVLIPVWNPIHLKTILEKWFWKEDKPEVCVMDVWEAFCRYPYLPRLSESQVLHATLSAGVQSQDFFAYASSKDADKYLGLLFGKSGQVYLDQKSLLIKPDAAKAYLDQVKPPEPPKPDEKADTGGVGPKQPKPGTPKTMKRFHGTVELDPINVGGASAKIAEEIIQHFTSVYGNEVKVTLEIQASSPDGFTESVQRAVQENANTLKFQLAEFEEV